MGVEQAEEEEKEEDEERRGKEGDHRLELMRDVLQTSVPRLTVEVVLGHGFDRGGSEEGDREGREERFVGPASAAVVDAAMRRAMTGSKICGRISEKSGGTVRSEDCFDNDDTSGGRREEEHRWQVLEQTVWRPTMASGWGSVIPTSIDEIPRTAPNSEVRRFSRVKVSSEITSLLHLSTHASVLN